MKTIKRVLTWTGIVFLILILCAGVYQMMYSMDSVETYEITPEKYEKKVLIATQGSTYKDSVIDGVLVYLKSKPVYVQVIDVSALTESQPGDWNAILILHTWEYSEPPVEVIAFIERFYKPDKVFVVTTSGSGAQKMDGVDAITSASLKEEIPDHTERIITKLKAVIEK